MGTSLNVLCAHLACGTVARAFSRYQNISITLRLLVLLVKERIGRLRWWISPRPGVTLSAPPDIVDLARDQEGLKTLGTIEEPEGCYPCYVLSLPMLGSLQRFIDSRIFTDSTKVNFVLGPGDGLTQVELLKLYCTTSPRRDEPAPYPVDAIQDINVIYPPVQSFLIASGLVVHKHWCR